MLIVLSTNLLFAQKLSYTIPERLPTAINSIWKESELFVSSNNSVFAFSRFREKSGSTHKELYLGTKNEQGDWSYVVQFPQDESVTKSEFQVVGINSNSKLYFVNRNDPRKPSLHVQLCENELCLYHLKHVKLEISRRELHSMYVHPNDSVILLSLTAKDDANFGQQNLFVSLKNERGQWSEPQSLGITVNSSSSEITPYLSNDKRRLFFSSNREESLGGYDVFYTERLYESWVLWTIPKQLEDSVNTIADEKFFFFNDQAAYFVSNREGSDDIYKSYEVKYNPFTEVGESR